VIQKSCDLETNAKILKGLGPQAPSIKQQAATFCRRTIYTIDTRIKHQATSCDNLANIKKFKYDLLLQQQQRRKKS
jgi:hypothetical protein